MESLPLKELDFGLQKPTGPSLVVLVFPGLDCPGVSLVEVCYKIFIGLQRSYIHRSKKNPGFYKA